MIRGTILRVAGTVVLTTLMVLAAVTGAQAKPNPKPPVATKLGVSAPAQVGAGESFDLKLTALSRKGAVVRDFKGVVKPSVASPVANLPAKVSFAKADKGRVTLRGLEATRAGDLVIGFGGALKGTGRTSVAAGPLSTLQLDSPATAVTGQGFAVSVRGADEFGNEVDAAGAVVSLTPGGECPANTCTAPRSGDYTVHADLGDVHAERAVQVSRGSVARIELNAPASVAAGAVFRPTAVAVDAQGRTLEEQSGEIAVSLSNGSCAAEGCAATAAGTVKVIAQVDGVSAERSVEVRPGPAKNLTLSPTRGIEMTEAQPTGANADYSKISGYPTSLTFAVTATDAYGNSVDASGAQLSGDGLSCSGLTCTGTGDGYRRLNATLGGASASKEIRVVGASQSYSMSCRGENYDLNGELADGCEYAQPNPGHTTADTATNLGRFATCADSGAQVYFSGTHVRDFREHTGVDGFDPGGQRYKGAPLVWKVQAGSGFCTNDISLKLEGNSAERACLSLTVRGEGGRLIESKQLGDNGSVVLEKGAGAYRDNEVLTFSVEASCWGSSYTNKTDFTVSGHL